MSPSAESISRPVGSTAIFINDHGSVAASSDELVHDLGGDVGLKDELDNGETSVERGGTGDALLELLLFPCMLPT